jgi:hypothetical protein
MFFCAEMEDEDELGPHLATLNTLLKQLPKYPKAVVCDLYHLFSCIVAYQAFNFMNSENVATIFGGMTDIMTSLMTSTQRSRLVRIMIDNFEVVFEGVNELETRADEPIVKETKEGIRVHFHDGTFKSLFCQSSEPGKDIRKKAIAKIQQTAEIVETAHHLYEIRDAMWRLVGDNEKVLPILKSGSALLITDKLKGDRSEKPAPAVPSPSEAGSTASIATSQQGASAASGASTPNNGSNSARGGSGSGDSLAANSAASSTKLATALVSKTGKVKREKSPRSSDSTTPPNSTTPTPTLAAAGSVQRDGLARPSPRETNTPPLSFGTSLKMLLWVFPNIPVGSVKATEWDPNSTMEGEAEMKCTPTGSSIVVVTGETSHRFMPTQMTPVDDSTRYFIMSTNTTRRVGLGFETREEAAKFKTLLQQMMQYDQIHAIDADQAATPLKSVTQFALGPLGFDQKLEDGFYDSGVIPTQTGSITSLRELASAVLDIKMPEVVLVNKGQDIRLERFVSVASKIVPPLAPVDERAKALALFVSNVLGGIDISDGVGSVDDQDSPYASLEGISRDSIYSLRTRTKSNIVKIGNVTHGVRRHRSILFKYIADRLEPLLPAALARTIPTSTSKTPSYAILIPYPRSVGTYSYVDLVNEPGFSYPHDSPVTESFASHMHGHLPKTSDAFNANLQLSHNDVNNAWYFGNAITHAPTVGNETVSRVYQQIGFSPIGKVYRGVLGTIPIAIKEIIVGSSSGSSADDLAHWAATQSEIGSHEHIMATFGFKIENGVARFVREYLGLGSLADQMKIAHSKSQPFDEINIWSIVHEIVSGIKFLHSKNKVHGNLSTSNVLLDGDAVLQTFTTVKLADPLINSSRSPLTEHNDCYRAPETLNNATASSAADIWSLGVIIAELASEHHFTAADFQTAIADAEAEFGSFAPIITECCNMDASKRPGIGALEIKAQAALFPPVSPHP